MRVRVNKTSLFYVYVIVYLSGMFVKKQLYILEP